MALRDKIADRSRPFITGDAPVRQTFLCQTGPNPFFFILTYLIIFAIQYRIVVVTDDAIYLLKAGKFRPAQPKELVAKLPRQQQLGPVKGLWSAVHLNGERHWVHKRFHKDVEAADQAMAAGAAH
jgi:hypothetical protein